MQALPQAAYFLLIEAAVGGAIALFWIHSRGEVSRGFTIFTGICLLVLGVLGVWLRIGFPPAVVAAADPLAVYWFAAERALTLAFVGLLAVYLVGSISSRFANLARLIGPLVPLVGLGGLWSAALVSPSGQLVGLGAPLTILAGAMALGSALVALSLGHWYLVTPTLSVRPLIQITLVCLGAVIVQIVLLPLVLLLPGAPADRIQALFSSYAIFTGVRVVFGLVVPLLASIMAWRTARIRSLDSATGLLYVLAALVLAGEISARTLYFLTGVTT